MVASPSSASTTPMKFPALRFFLPAPKADLGRAARAPAGRDRPKAAATSSWVAAVGGAVGEMGFIIGHDVIDVAVVAGPPSPSRSCAMKCARFMLRLPGFCARPPRRSATRRLAIFSACAPLLVSL